MTSSSSQKRKALKTSRKATHTHRQKAAALAAAFSAAAVVVATLPYLDKVPQHNSILTGRAWVRELLSGHPRRFHNMMGLSKPVFRRLPYLLIATWHSEESSQRALHGLGRYFLYQPMREGYFWVNLRRVSWVEWCKVRTVEV
jgi:hypothetical protein